MASSIFAALDGFMSTLVDTLTADADLADVQVSFGDEGDERQPERIWFGAVQFQGDIPVCTGPPSESNPLWREVHALVPIEVAADIPKQSIPDGHDRVCELAGVVEAILAADPNLSDLDGVVQATLQFGAVNVGRYEAGVQASARLTLDLWLRATEAST